MSTTKDKIKELKQLLWILDSKHSVSIPQTQENINYIADEIVKLFAIPDVSKRFFIGQKVIWDDIVYWVMEDNGEPKVLVANSENRHDDEYNDWWVYRYELNAC